MRNASIILAALSATALAVCGYSQISADFDSQWRAKIRPDKENTYSFSSLSDALKIAERSGGSDVRLFETLTRLAVHCQDDDIPECEGKAQGYTNRALQMAPSVKPRDAHFATLLMELGAVVDPKVAPGVFKEALDIRERLFGAEDQSVAEAYAAMAAAYQENGDPVGARRTIQYALEIRERVHQERSPGYADLLEDSARIYTRANDARDAQAEYERAIALRETLWGDRDPRFVDHLRRIASASWFNNHAFSEKLYRRVAEIQRNIHGENSEASYAALVDLAGFLRSQKRFAESQQTFESACAARDRMGKKDAAEAYCLENVGRVRMSRGMYKEAIQAGESGLEIRRNLQKPQEKNKASLDALLAEACLDAHDQRKSEMYFVALHNEVGIADRFTLIDTAEKLSTTYEQRGDYQAAATKLEVAVASIEAQDPADPRLPQEEVRLARLYQMAGRPNDATRMNMAVLRSLGGTMKNVGDPARMKWVIIGALAVFLGFPTFGTATFAVLLAWMARKMDRRLAKLFEPVSNEPGPFTPPESTSAEPAFVGSFLGLSAIDGAQVHPDVTTVAVEEAIAPPEQMLVAATLDIAAAENEDSLPVAEPSASQVNLHADGTDLFAMRVLNLLLSLLTLGIYSFWGKAKVRRYVCGQAEYLGDWFAFHGTGRELLLGWLRALPALAFIFLFPSMLPLFWQHRFSMLVAQLCAALAFLLLWPIARVGAYRYRLNRMSWRAIRFSYRGKAPLYLGETVVGCLISVLTLGIYIPFFHTRLRRLLLNRTYFGDRGFHFVGRGADLVPAWLCALPLTVCSFGIGWAWWRALSHRYYWARTTFSGGRFRCTVTGGKLLWLWVGNACHCDNARTRDVLGDATNSSFLDQPHSTGGRTGTRNHPPGCPCYNGRRRKLRRFPRFRFRILDCHDQAAE